MVMAADVAWTLDILLRYSNKRMRPLNIIIVNVRHFKFEHSVTARKGAAACYGYEVYRLSALVTAD